MFVNDRIILIAHNSLSGTVRRPYLLQYVALRTRYPLKRVADDDLSATLSTTTQPSVYQSIARLFAVRLQMADKN